MLHKINIIWKLYVYCYSSSGSRPWLCTACTEGRKHAPFLTGLYC